MSHTTDDLVTPGRADEQTGDRAGQELTVVLGQSNEESLSQMRQTLEQGGFTIVAEARDAVEVVNAAFEHEPRLCVLEIDLPGSALAASRRIYTKLPDTRIAMLADSVIEGAVFRAVEAGADGYLLKDTDASSMQTALRAVIRGEPALPRALTARLVQELRGSASQQGQREDGEGRGAVNRSLLYVPRFAKHLRHRMRAGMPLSMAVASARDRMATYR